MKMDFKRFLAFFLMLVLSFAVCACAGNTPIDPNSGGNQQEQEEEQEEEEGQEEEEEEEEEEQKDKELDPKKVELYGYTPVISQVLPKISINTVSGSNEFALYPNRDVKLYEGIEYEGASISVSNCDEKYEITDAVAEVKARGNYTLNYDKKPIRIKFDKKNTMLGLNNDQKFKSWVLLAEWKDLSALNNATSFYLGKTILGSDGYYSSDFRHVEVYLNNEYWGVYLLVEQQQTGEGRVDIFEPDDGYEGVDIGYLVEYDGYYVDENPELGGDPTFAIDYQGNDKFWQKGYTLKSDIYSTAQVNFIQNYMENAYKLAYLAVNNSKYYKFNDDYTKLVATTYASLREAAEAVIDVKSLVNMYILQEIACDPDINWSSFYISVDMSSGGNKRLTFVAPWDFDSAFGIREGFMNSAVGMYAASSQNPWLDLFVREAWFKDMVKEKWQELVLYGVIEKSVSLIDDYVNTYEQYFVQNFTKWESRVWYGNGELVWELNSFYDKDTAQRNAAMYLKRWLTSRYEYLDSVFGTGELAFGSMGG